MELDLLREFPEFQNRLSHPALNSLALRSLGCNVLATDIPTVISTVLNHNIANNTVHCSADSSFIEVRELDWTVHPNQWSWDNNKAIASHTPQPLPANEPTPRLKPPFDLIVSSDTLYIPSLTQPLLRTLHALSVSSLSASPPFARPPLIYICIERRDPALIDRTLQEARDIWNFRVNRIPSKKLARAMGKGGIDWVKSEWEDIEIWKLTLDGKLASNPDIVTVQ